MCSENERSRSDNYLHPDDGVDEEEHRDEQADVWQRLERLHERPQQDPDGVALAEQLDEPGRAEQPQEANIERIGLCTRTTKKIVIQIPNSVGGVRLALRVQARVANAFAKSV